MKLKTLFCAGLIVLAGCDHKEKGDPVAEAPPPAVVEKETDSSIVKVEHPEKFALVTAGKRASATELTVTGVVNPDVSRNVPVISLASGRVVEIHAKLGDEVKKGDPLMRIQSADITGAFADHRKAVVNEQLARTQLDRAKTLYEKGAIAKKDVDVAQNAEDTALVDVQAAADRLKVLGADVDHPTGVIEISAPASGVIVEQNVTAAAGVKTLDNSPNLFTIADLSRVWVVCDVYENDLSSVHVGEFADIRLNAYPGRVLRARISNIGPVLDPTNRAAKVRLEVENPGLLRIGMFVTAVFHGSTAQMRATVPASAILHLHDRDWVYVPTEGGRFRRVEVTAGLMLPGNMQEIVAGIEPGTQLVANALVLENAAEQ
jgi:membrane fusion protein, heavy metal efflux system